MTGFGFTAVCFGGCGFGELIFIANFSFNNFLFILASTNTKGLIINIMNSKNIIALVVFLTMNFLGYSQADHILFKGVPVDGTLAEYVSKMEEAGFNVLGSEDGTTLLEGDFAGYNNCFVSVATLKQKDLVYKIGVLFPNKETWSELSNNYFDLKDMLIEKYGKPTTVTEKFVGFTDAGSDDNSKMFKVKLDNCKFSAVWKTEKGEIQLIIDHESVSRCFVRLLYIDKINGNIIKAKAKSEL
jgi:hypothetical protein